MDVGALVSQLGAVSLVKMVHLDKLSLTLTSISVSTSPFSVALAGDLVIDGNSIGYKVKWAEGDDFELGVKVPGNVIMTLLNKVCFSFAYFSSVAHTFSSPMVPLCWHLWHFIRSSVVSPASCLRRLMSNRSRWICPQRMVSPSN